MRALTPLFLLLTVTPSARCRDSLQPDYAGIRGCNYVPSYASTSVGIWKDFQPEVIGRELGYARRVGLNAVRMFLQYVVWEHDPKHFLDRLDRFIDIADKSGLRTMIVLFDSCFGDEPSIEKAGQKMWVNNPGYSRLGKDNWPKLEKYVRDVAGRYKGDPRILAWDVMNEPEADFNHVTRTEREHILRFVRHFCGRVKTIDPTHPITVGHAVVEFIPSTMDLVDVLSVHSYQAEESWLQNDLSTALGYGKESGKPVLVTEFGNPVAGHSYELGLDVIERNRMGFFLWELMIGKIMFNDMQGLFYPDGEVRDLAPVARLLGFRLKRGGIPVRKVPPEVAEIRAVVNDPSRWPQVLRDAEHAPRTSDGIRKHLERLGTIARLRLRPRAEAGELFQLGLSIPHLFRLGNDRDAVAAYEEFLRLARKALSESPQPQGAAR
jgi:hypothetical protein